MRRGLSGTCRVARAVSSAPNGVGSTCHAAAQADGGDGGGRSRVPALSRSRRGPRSLAHGPCATAPGATGGMTFLHR